jgi:uncharacterized membrane protein
MTKTSKPIVRFFRTTLIGGILFLFPVSALVLVLAKPVALARKFVEPIGDKLPFGSIVGLETPLLLALLLIILLCFLSGLLAVTPLAKKGVEKAEAAILSKVPAYGLLKSLSLSLAGEESDDTYSVVMLTIDRIGQFALLIEKGDGEDDLATVFVPDAPNARSGGVFFVPGDLITLIDVSLSEAMRSLKSFGVGSADIRNRMLPGNAGNEGAATGS